MPSHKLPVTVVPEVIVFVGIQRSGNHGLLNWIKGHGPENSVHINSLDINSLDTKEFFTKLDEESELQYSDRLMIGLKGREQIIISLENYKLHTPDGIENLQNFQKDTNATLVLLLRSPLNNIASIYKVTANNGAEAQIDSTKVIRKLWHQYAKEFTDSKIKWDAKILFDKWIIDRAYRNRMGKGIGFVNVDSDFNKISGHGVSSFDLSARNSQEIDLEGRFLLFKEDSVYTSIIRDEKMLEKWFTLAKSEGYSIPKIQTEYIHEQLRHV
jgi:hypothetical protein